VTDAAAFALFLVGLKIPIGSPVYGAIWAIQVTDTAANATVLVPLRKPSALVAGAEGAGLALIKQRAINHLLCEFYRFQNPSPFDKVRSFKKILDTRIGNIRLTEAQSPGQQAAQVMLQYAVTERGDTMRTVAG
jgi:hypothetical protein